MKLSIFAAGALALAGLMPGVAATANAQRTVVHERTVVRHGPAPRAWHSRKVCRVTYRHHHRVRTCRVVRSR